MIGGKNIVVCQSDGASLAFPFCMLLIIPLVVVFFRKYNGTFGIIKMHDSIPPPTPHVFLLVSLDHVCHNNASLVSSVNPDAHALEGPG